MSNKEFCVVGIGASAGGLEALQDFFSNLGKVEGYAFVVVQHLSPDYKSLMPELLSRHTSLEVGHIEDGTTIVPGRVYLLPPKNNVSVFNNKLFLTPPEPDLNLPIDMFLTSLAEEFRDKAVGIILSGTGTDGTRGVRAIKEHGGLVIAQTEDSAAFDGMPRSAIATGLCDAVLTPMEMARDLSSIGKGLLLSPSAETQIVSSSKVLSKILSLVKIKTGLDFSYYKENTITRRIERRINICKCSSAEEYLRYIENNPQEIETLHREFLIGVTRFFRDPGAYKTLKEKVLPLIMNHKGVNDQIRVWVAGCSTGEEAYSIAIIFDEYFESIGLRPDIKIFATDIDRGSLDVAAQGIYPLSIAADASFDRLGKYFFKKGDGYQIQPRIRKQIVFAYHNIIKDPPFPRIDLITCRNLLIYLQSVLQKKVLSNFHFSLNKDGFLFLGSSESVGEFAGSFTVFSASWKIHRFTGKESKIPLQAHFEREPKIGANYPEIVLGSKGLYNNEQDLFLTQLMEACMPPTVLVDSERHIHHLFGDVDRFLQMKAGKPDLDILKMARGNLSLPLGSLLQPVINGDEEHKTSRLPFREDNDVTFIQVTVRTLRTAPNRKHFAITFEKPESSSVEMNDFDIETGIKNRIADLERELQYTKESLQATIEELETSNEELQATNEELLAANEELQSTNEELQSVNEELITVNAEYQSKIHELMELNEDMDNLMSATHVGVIFLDRELRIRRYTDAATKVFKIISSDIDRPMEDLSYTIDLPNLTDDLRTVLTRNKEIITEAQDNDGNWYEVSLIPYFGKETSSKGVLVVLIDISRPKMAEEALKREHDLFMKVLENSPVATTVVNKEGNITFANTTARKLLGLVDNKDGEVSFDDPDFEISDLEGTPIPSNELPFSIILKTGQCMGGFSHKITRNGETRTLSISGCPMFDENNEVDGVVFKIEDVSSSDR